MYQTAVFAILGYLSGSIFYSQVAARLFGVQDITRDTSDGNPGVFNAFAKGGFTVGLFALCGDLLKGAAPLLLWRRVCPDWMNDPLLPLMMAAPLLRTLYPVFRHFRGGKGITVSFGILLGLIPLWKPVLLLAACFLFFSVILVVESHYFRTLIVFAAFLAAVCLGSLAPLVKEGCVLLSVCELLTMILRYRETEPLEVHLLWKH